MQKHFVAKVLLVIWELFLHENNHNYNSYRSSYKFAIILFFFPFLQTKNKNQVFSSWWFGNNKYFCFLFIASRALFQSHAEFNRLL